MWNSHVIFAYDTIREEASLSVGGDKSVRSYLSCRVFARGCLHEFLKVDMEIFLLDKSA